MKRTSMILGVALAIVTITACVTDDGDGDDDEVIVPVDGTYGGDGIAFSVEGGGTTIRVTFADYGSCSGGGCQASATATCRSCTGQITPTASGEITFVVPSLGCSGRFDAATSASGSCSYRSDCGCLMTNSWVADAQ